MDEEITESEFYGDSLLLYDSVLIELASRINIIRKASVLHNERDPIENVKTRIKSPKSMINKLKMKGLEPVAGSRQHCRQRDRRRRYAGHMHIYR